MQERWLLGTPDEIATKIVANGSRASAWTT